MFDILTLHSTQGLPVNLLVFLIDDISRQQFARSMRETTKLLEEELLTSNDTIVFKFPRYNIIGPNSMPNQKPMFLGQYINPKDSGMNILLEDAGTMRNVDVGDYHHAMVTQLPSAT